jgi:hypothetical protein
MQGEGKARRDNDGRGQAGGNNNHDNNFAQRVMIRPANGLSAAGALLARDRDWLSASWRNVSPGCAQQPLAGIRAPPLSRCSRTPWPANGHQTTTTNNKRRERIESFACYRP